MSFTKTSQKFGQWSDIRANTVYGLGFGSESELNKVIKQLKLPDKREHFLIVFFFDFMLSLLKNFKKLKKQLVRQLNKNPKMELYRTRDRNQFNRHKSLLLPLRLELVIKILSQVN